MTRAESEKTRRAVDDATLALTNARRAHERAVAAVVEALLAGASLRRVAKATGLAVNTVIRWRDEAGLVPYSGHQYRFPVPTDREGQ